MSQKKTKFIALAGHKQTGKDESAKILTRLLAERGLTSRVTYFATPLKEFCIAVLGLPRDKVYGSDADKSELSFIQWDKLPHMLKLKYHPSNMASETKSHYREGYMSIREVLQIVGTDIVREMLWSDAWSSYPFRQKWAEDVILIPDCRFENEVDEVLKAGGTILRLERNTGLTDNHASELALDNYNFDFKYENNGSIAELESYLKGFLNAIL